MSPLPDIPDTRLFLYESLRVIETETETPITLMLSAVYCESSVGARQYR